MKRFKRALSRKGSFEREGEKYEKVKIRGTGDDNKRLGNPVEKLSLRDLRGERRSSTCPQGTEEDDFNDMCTVFCVKTLRRQHISAAFQVAMERTEDGGFKVADFKPSKLCAFPSGSSKPAKGAQDLPEADDPEDQEKLDILGRESKLLESLPPQFKVSQHVKIDARKMEERKLWITPEGIAMSDALAQEEQEFYSWKQLVSFRYEQAASGGHWVNANFVETLPKANPRRRFLSADAPNADDDRQDGGDDDNVVKSRSRSVSGVDDEVYIVHALFWKTAGQAQLVKKAVEEMTSAVGERIRTASDAKAGSAGGNQTPALNSKLMEVEAKLLQHTKDGVRKEANLIDLGDSRASSGFM